MSIKKIKQHNDQQFLQDIKDVRDVLVYAPATNTFLVVRKKEVLKEAELQKIQYYISDNIFVSKRNAMVII